MDGDVKRRKPRKNRRGKAQRKSAFKDGLNKKYLTFEEAKNYMADIPYITSKVEYKDWCRIKKYTFLPRVPESVYRREWTSWPDYLGVEPMYAFYNKDYYSYFEAIGIVHKVAAKYDLKTGEDWLLFYDDQYLIVDPTERDLPIEKLPRHPVQKYDECDNFKQWLGTEEISKIETMQKRQEIVQEIKEDLYAEYAGQPVFALTTGVDPLKRNLVKVIADNNGLASLLRSIEQLQYDILAIFIFDVVDVNYLTQTLISNGLDYGDNSYLINDIPTLLRDMRQQTIELDRKYYH